MPYPGLEGHFRLDEPELLEVVDEQNDRHASAPQLLKEFPEENAVRNGRELHDQEVAFPEVREGLLPDFIGIPVFLERRGDGRIVPLELQRDLHFFHPEFRKRELHVRPRLVGRVLQVGVLRLALGNVITVLVHVMTGGWLKSLWRCAAGDSKHPFLSFYSVLF